MRQPQVQHGQPINMSLVASNFGEMTRTILPRLELPKYQQPYDQMNVLERYNGRAMQIDTEIFTAEMMNDRAVPVLAVLAPILPMTEHHVTWTKREHYMLPFDISAIGGVPRRTFAHQTQDSAHLQHYIRFASMELNYLLDVNFGRQMLNETLAVIVAQARLTLVFQFQWGIARVALEQTYRSFTAETRSAQYYHTQSAFFALGNSNPDDLAHKIITQVREPHRKFSHLLVVEQMGRHLKEIATESRTVEGYHYGYDPETERLVIAVFDAMEGVPAIPTTDGGFMAVMENIALRYSNIGAQRMAPTQTLEGYATLCEVILQPDVDPDDDEEISGLRDPVTYDQTEISIEHKPLSYAEGLSACGLWNDPETGEVADPGDFGQAYKDLIESYNKTKKTALLDKLQNPRRLFRGNNTPTGDDWGRAVADMDFRNGFPFVTVDATKKLFTEATYIGSVPRPALPTPFVERIVRVLHKDLKRNHRGITVDDFMDSVLPDNARGGGHSSSTSSPAATGGNPSPPIPPSGPTVILRPLSIPPSGPTVIPPPPPIPTSGPTYSQMRKEFLNLFFDEKKGYGRKAIATVRSTIVDIWKNLDTQRKNDLLNVLDVPVLQKIDELHKRVTDFQDQTKTFNFVDQANAETDFKTISEEIEEICEDAAAILASIDKLQFPFQTIEVTGTVSYLKKVLPTEDFSQEVAAFALQFANTVKANKGKGKDKDKGKGKNLFWQAHVPDSHVARFSAAFDRMQKEKETTSNPDAVERGFDAVMRALRQTSGFLSSKTVIDDLAAHMESGRSVADFGNGRANLITMKAMSQQRALPDEEMTAAFAARREISERDDDAMDIDGDYEHQPQQQQQQTSFGVRSKVDTAGLDDKFKAFPILVQRLGEIAWKTADEERIFYRLMTAYFSHDNCYSLYKRYGLQLFKLNYWRPWQRYRMFHMIAMIPGPQTAVTGFCQPIVMPSMQGMEGYINIVGQFWSALIVTEPNNVRHIPNVITAGLLTNINTEFVRTRKEFQSTAPQKPSVVAEVVPLDETKYNWPLHMLEAPVMNPGDHNEESPFAKHQGKDLLQIFGGASYLNQCWVEALESDSMAEMAMSLVGHRGFVMHLDKRTGRYNVIDGIGPRGKACFNCIGAAEAWAGNAVRFPMVTAARYTVPVNA